MRSDVRLTVGPDGNGGLRILEMIEAAPLAWRRTPDAVYMIGTAASPVDRDDVAITVRVLAGASLTLRSAAASVLWSGAGTRQRVRVVVEAGAELIWCPDPVIATAGCAHRQRVTVDLHPTGRLQWRELLVLGRQSEGPGTVNAILRVTVGGSPLLHHGIATGPGHPGWDGAAVLASTRVLGQLVMAGAGMDDITPASGRCGDGRHPESAASWSVSPLAGPGGLATVTAAGVGAAEAALREAALHFPSASDPIGRP